MHFLENENHPVTNKFFILMKNESITEAIQNSSGGGFDNIPEILQYLNEESDEYENQDYSIIKVSKNKIIEYNRSGDKIGNISQDVSKFELFIFNFNDFHLGIPIEDIRLIASGYFKGDIDKIEQACQLFD